MTADEAAIVRHTFERIRPSAEIFGRLLYERLFALDPSLRGRFHRPVDQQARMMVQMLGVALGRLPSLDAVAPALNALGARHATYGIGERDFATFRSALLSTLESTLGDDFTGAARAAWDEAYCAIAREMQAGALARVGA